MRNKFEFEELVYEKASVISNHEHHVIKMGRITATLFAEHRVRRNDVAVR